MTSNSKKVKAITPGYLRNLALWYLERFGGTRARVRRTLQKRVLIAAQEYGPDQRAEGWIEQTLDELEQSGLINDAAFAAARVRKGLRLGKSRALIAQDLAHAGVAGDVAAAALAEELPSDHDPDFEAAQRYVRAKRLGPWRPDPQAFAAKDMARLARRGFSYDVARRALKAEEDEAVA